MLGNAVNSGSPLYILMISVHSLIRGKDLDLGCDADTDAGPAIPATWAP